MTNKKSFPWKKIGYDKLLDCLKEANYCTSKAYEKYISLYCDGYDVPSYKTFHNTLTYLRNVLDIDIPKNSLRIKRSGYTQYKCTLSDEQKCELVTLYYVDMLDLDTVFARALELGFKGSKGSLSSFINKWAADSKDKTDHRCAQEGGMFTGVYNIGLDSPYRCTFIHVSNFDPILKYVPNKYIRAKSKFNTTVSYKAYVWCSAYKKCINDNESIIFKDGDETNFSIENLYLVSLPRITGKISRFPRGMFKDNPELHVMVHEAEAARIQAEKVLTAT